MKNSSLISKIKSLDALTAEEKAELIALLNNTKKYGLVWEDKPEDVEELLRTQLPVFQEVPERRILAQNIQPATEKTEKPTDHQQTLFDEHQTLASTSSATKNTEQQTKNNEQQTTNPKQQTTNKEQKTPNHILIEGDNLHALTALTFTHEGKIDVIYIDPPYNTGNKDFKYNDRFVDREDSYRHSKWLSFMHKRLQIAKKLLSDKGVIFISIDDNEQAQLRLLCDEIFSENFICNVIWQKIDGPKNSARYFSDDHEYILCFAKSIQNWRPNLVNRSDEMVARYKNIDNDPRGPWLLSDLAARNFYGAGRYPIKTPSGRIIEGPPAGSYWRVSEEKFMELLNDNRIWFGEKGNNRPGIKRFLSEVRQGVVPQTMWFWKDVGSTRNSKQEFSQLMAYSANDDLFVTPKPVKLISRTIQIGSSNSSIVLDFFAGSGTTLHATMQLNAEDGGNRQCILVTNNENNIAEEVCYERNRRVIEGYTSSKGQWVEGLPNNNFRYYKTEFVGSAKTEANRRKLTRLSTALLQLKEDCYHDITTTAGFDPESCHISANGSRRYLVVIYHNRQRPALIEQLREWIKTLPETDEKIRMYAFSDEKEVLLDDFYDVAERIMAVPLPDAIYNAYRATFRKLGFDRKDPAKAENKNQLPANPDELDFNAKDNL